MAQDKTRHSDFERGWIAALDALLKVFDEGGALAVDMETLRAEIRHLKKHRN